MELKSEPQFEMVNVTDIDIAFQGDVQSYTLREGVDTIKRVGDVIEITLGTVGRLQFHLQHAHWMAERKRTIRVVVPEAQSAKSAAGPQPASAE